MSGSRITVVGSANADLVSRVRRHPNPGETVLADNVQTFSGGKGANQAVAAARLGGQVSFIGAVGDDEFAAVALAGLRAAQVDLAGLKTVPGSTGLAIITVNAAGENTIVVVPGANSAMDQDTVAAYRDAIAQTDVLVVQGEIPVSGIAAAVESATGRVIVNLAPVVRVPQEVLRRADPLVVNEHEGALVLEQLGVHVDKDDEYVARQLVAWGVPSVVMTRGAQGAMVATHSYLENIPTPRVTPIDTTGAGDAFVGALAYGLARGESLTDAARRAARVGAFAVTRNGAQASYPTSGDVLPEVE